MRQYFYYKMRYFYFKMRLLLQHATILLENATVNCAMRSLLQSALLQTYLANFSLVKR